MGNCRRVHLVTFLALACAVAACEDNPPAIVDARTPDAAAVDATTTDVDASGPDASGPDATDIDAVGVDAGDSPPGPITNFAAGNVATGLALTWTNPTDADLAGVLIVAGAGVPVTFAPTDGMAYTVGTVVGAGQAVINASLATTLASFPGIAGVTFSFSGWAYDAVTQYSAVADTTGRTDVLGTQTGQIQVFLDGTVVVTQQPTALLLSGTAAVDKGGTIALQLGVENQTARLLFNLKGLVDSASQGTVTNPPFPTVGGLPMAYYGPAAIAPGDAPISQIDVTGIDGTVDPVVLTVHFVDAPAILATAGGGGKGSGSGVIVADSTGDRVGTVGLADQPCASAAARGGALSADARWLYTGAKSLPRLTRVDLTTLTTTESAILVTSTGTGAIGDVALSADGTRVYAVVHDGTHAKGGAGCGVQPEFFRTARRLDRGPRRLDRGPRGGAPARTRAPLTSLWIPAVVAGGAPMSNLALAEFDASTLQLLRTLVLATGAIDATLGRIALVSPTRAVIGTQGGMVNVVDLTTFTQVDTDAATPGVQPLDLGVGRWLGEAAVSPGGATIAFASDELGVVTVVRFDGTTLAPIGAAITLAVPGLRRVVDLAYDPGGRLTLLTRGTPSVLMRLDLAGTALAIVHADLADASAMMFPRGGRYLVGLRGGDVRGFLLADDSEIDFDGDAGNGVSPLFVGEQFRPHGLAVVTPF